MANTDDIKGAPLAAYQHYIKMTMQERGFDDETVSQKFMMFLEEAGEFAQAAREKPHNKHTDETLNGELSDEAGDLFIVFLDICNQLGIDLEKAFLEKERKNIDQLSE